MKPTYGIAPPGFRLPAETHLGGVTLQVADLSRSMSYYEELLGFIVLDRSRSEAALGVSPGRPPIVILRERPGVRPVPRGGLLGLYHFAILLPDRLSLGRFAAHLAARRIHAGAADHAVSEALYLSDPDGLGIEIYADRPQHSWRVDANGQLHMTTEPLDVPALVAAGAGEAWMGMPAGTVLGHVHLHVGDLGAASAFYHAALGFDKTVWTYPGALFLSAGGYHHHLGTNTWSAGPPAGETDARLLSWDIVVGRAEHAAAAAQSLQAAGHAVARVDATGWQAADPWGTRVRLVVDSASAALVTFAIILLYGAKYAIRAAVVELMK
jgi:catechol 2,3-dioxygenase